MRDLDIRCTARLPDPDVDYPRCQLGAGHEGEHAVMFCAHLERLVRCWDTRDGADSDHVEQDVARPWCRGYPVPEWVDESTDGPSPLVTS